MARDDPQMKLRMPANLRDRIAEAAEANNRSMNAEIVTRLETSFNLEENDRLNYEALGEVSEYHQKRLNWAKTEFEFARNYMNVLKHRIDNLEGDINTAEENKGALKSKLSGHKGAS